jgi:glutamyl-tRNA reductase
MNIGVVGINHKLAGVTLREKLAKAFDRRFGRTLHLYHKGSFILLSTCNRTELYFSAEDLAETHSYIFNILRNEVEDSFEQKLYSFFGVECLGHLCRVTCGLDSAILAETEIQGQVKGAYHKACNQVTLPSPLHYLFQKSLHVAKKIRNQYLTHCNPSNLEQAIYDAITECYPHMEGKEILFIGASTTNIKVIRHLKALGIKRMTLCNRTDSKADDIARAEGVKTLPWRELTEWPLYDCVILGTKSNEILIHPEDMIDSVESKRLIIDLCVPRNASPSLRRLPHVHLLNIDQLNRRINLRRLPGDARIEHAEDYVERSANRYHVIYQNKQRQRSRYSQVS